MGSHSPEMTPTKEKYARVGQATFGTLFFKKIFYLEFNSGLYCNSRNKAGRFL